IISSSRLTALPDGRVWKPDLLLTSNWRLTLSAGWMLLPLVVCIIASGPVWPVRPPSWPKAGAIRSRGLKFGGSALDTFSGRPRWGAWGHSVLVRDADQAGRSLIDIAPLRCSPASALRRQVGRICRVYG